MTGGRTYNDLAAMQRALSEIPSDAVLVHGAAPGADSLAATAWTSTWRTAEPHPADWRMHGKAAGPIRNQQMVDSGLDLLIVFPGGRGTADMTRRAISAGIPIWCPIWCAHRDTP